MENRHITEMKEPHGHIKDHTVRLKFRAIPDIVSDLVASTRVTPKMKIAMIVLGALTVVGIVALIIKLVLFTGQQQSWGYVAATLAFTLSVSSMGPTLYIISFLARGYWARALGRISVLLTLCGVVATTLLIPLVIQLPPLLGEDGIRRRSVWFEAPSLSPHFWIIVAMLFLIVCGIALFYMTSLPDLVKMRDYGSGWRARLAGKLTRGWVGKSTQWRFMRAFNGSFAVMYLLSAALVHFLLTSDFDMALVPGWRDAIYPGYHILTSMQIGFAAITLIAFWARRNLGLGMYLTLDHFWSVGRLVFVASLGWFYAFFSGFIVFWYGRSGSDIAYVDLFIVGPFLWAFIIAIIFSFVIPWLTMLWNPVRRSFWGPVIASISVVIGIFFDRIRLFVPAWSVPGDQINDRYLMEIPGFVAPDVWDILIMTGSLAAIILIILGVTRVVPVISAWQILEYRLLVKPVKYLRTHGILVAKSD